MPKNSKEILDKLKTLNPPAIALVDSESLPVSGADGQVQYAEKVLTDQGYYLSSPVNGWDLVGPF